jgi:hypothetical protein
LTNSRPMSSIIGMPSQGSHPLRSGESPAAEWESNGYFCANEFLSSNDCRQLIRAAEHMVHEDEDAIVRYESNLSDALPADQRVSKLYRFHRAQPFKSLATSQLGLPDHGNRVKSAVEQD